MTLVYFLGTDGAGKTTTLRKLMRLGFPKCRLKYLYCQHRPLLLWLLKLPARLLFLRKANQFANYAEYKQRKDSVTRKSPFMTRLYSLVWYLDVILQTWPKLLWARCTADVVLLDRYYLDWVVNVGELSRNSAEGMLRDAARLERILPRAELHVFLDVSEETAFKRKSDIQSVQYLRERKERYRQLAGHYDFKVIDANQDADTVLHHVQALLAADLDLPARQSPPR